jgi:hypothetical protein
MTHTLALTLTALLGAAPTGAFKLSVLDDKPIKIVKGDDEERQLLKERYNVSLSGLQARIKLYQVSPDVSAASVFDAAQRTLAAELDLCTTPAERVTVREKQLEVARELERMHKDLYEAGRVSRADMELAVYHRIDAQLQLLRAKKAAEAKPK